MAAYLGGGKIQEFLDSGAFDVGGTIETYVAGTSTHRTTYPTIADALAGTNANDDWPLELNSRGTLIAAINGPTDVIYVNSLGTTIWTVYGLDSEAFNIYDSDANPLLLFTETSDAVNYTTIANAPAGQAPSIKATGGDTNIDYKIASKNAGTMLVDGGATGKVKINSIATGDIEFHRAAKAKSTFDVENGSAATFSGAQTTTGLATFNGGVTMSLTAAFNLLPAGIILPYAKSTAPDGAWLICEGSAISRITYAVLFAVIGTTFGSGNGTTTFNLPNLSGRVIVGSLGTSDATLGNTIGATGGERSHILTIAELAAHSHTDVEATGTTAAAAGAAFAAYSQTTQQNTSTVGSSNAHNNIQPSIVLNYIIRAY